MRMNYVELDANKSSSASAAAMDALHGFPYPSQFTWTHIIASSVVVTVVMLVIITGNSFVIVAIVTDRRLKTLQNWFIVSLAVSDLLVGVFIMPLSLTNELMGYWFFGRTMCDLWLATDVLLCTASILNLCLISLDRYWSVVRAVDGYSQRRTKRRVLGMIGTVWVLSVLISLPPLVGWKRPQPTKEGFPLCVLSEEPGYVVYSTVGSFFLPLVIMVLVYCRLYQTAVSRARRSLRNLTPPPTQSLAAAALVQRRRTLYQSANAFVSHRLSFFRLSSSARLEYRSVSSRGDNFVSEVVPVKYLPVAGAADESTKSEALQVKQLNDTCGTETREESELTCCVRVDVPLRIGSVGCGSRMDTFDASALSCNLDTPGIHGDDMEVAFKRGSSQGRNMEVPFDWGSSQGHFRRGKFRLQSACLSAIDKRRELKTCSEQELLDPVAPTSTLPNPVETEDGLEMSKKAAPMELPTKIDIAHSDGTRQEDGERRQKRRQLLKLGSIETGVRRGKRRVVRAREKRATLVLGLVMASFIGCWLPFFSTYVIVSLTSVNVTDMTFAVIFWLGYCNSALNPVIYTVFNRDFRSAFLRLIFRKRAPSLDYRSPPI